MKTEELVERLDLSLFTFNENEKVFEQILVEGNCEVDSYCVSAEVIKIVKYLRENNIEYVEDNFGNIVLSA